MKTSTKILLGVGTPLVSLSPLVSLASCSGYHPDIVNSIDTSNLDLYIGIKNIEWNINHYGSNNELDTNSTFLGDIWYKNNLKLLERKHLDNPNEYWINIEKNKDIKKTDIHLVIKGILVSTPVTTPLVSNLNIYPSCDPTTESMASLNRRLEKNSKLCDGDWNQYYTNDKIIYDANDFEVVYNNKKIDIQNNNIKLFTNYKYQMSYEDKENKLTHSLIDVVDIKPFVLSQEEIEKYGFKNKFPIQWNQYGPPLASNSDEQQQPIYFHSNIPSNKIYIKSLDTGYSQQRISGCNSGDSTGVLDLNDDWYNKFSLSTNSSTTKPFIKNYKSKNTLLHKKEIYLNYPTKAELDTAIANKNIDLNTLFKMSDVQTPIGELFDQQIIEYAPYIYVQSEEIRNLLLNDPNYKIKLSKGLDYSSNPILVSKIKVGYEPKSISASIMIDNSLLSLPPTDKPTNNIQ